MSSLVTIEEAAERLGGIPLRSLHRAAVTHGYLVKIGRAVRIDADQLPELIDFCRQPPVGCPPSTDAY